MDSLRRAGVTYGHDDDSARVVDLIPQAAFRRRIAPRRRR
jgi:hypothetical protein